MGNLNYMNCKICQNNKFKEILKMSDNRYWTTNKVFKILSCKNCGVFVTIDGNDTINPEQYYTSEYQSFQEKLIIHRKISSSKKVKFFENIGYAPNRLTWTNKINLTKDTKVLDVGCGSGYISSYIRQIYSSNVIGIEPSSQAAQIAAKNDIKVHNGTLLDFNDESNFDVAILIHVLEHFSDPLENLSIIRKLLKDNGKLVIAVPNVDAIERKLFRENWDAWDIPRHVYHYTPKSLNYLLNKAGFKILSTNYERYSLLSRSIFNKFRKSIPYNSRNLSTPVIVNINNIWGTTLGLLKASSAIQIIAEKTN